MTQTIRPDIDIEEDIHDLIAHYPPLQRDRHQLRIDVRDGEVILSGHAKSPISERYLVDHVAQVQGVRSVNSDQLYNEEEIRLEAGRRIPMGVLANATYGTVILTGTPPQERSAVEIAGAVGQVPGVERVIVKFQ